MAGQGGRHFRTLGQPTGTGIRIYYTKTQKFQSLYAAAAAAAEEEIDIVGHEHQTGVGVQYHEDWKGP
jgi:hypothetical protein